jgi:hypothetical protein
MKEPRQIQAIEVTCQTGMGQVLGANPGGKP